MHAAGAPRVSKRTKGIRCCRCRLFLFPRFKDCAGRRCNVSAGGFLMTGLLLRHASFKIFGWRCKVRGDLSPRGQVAKSQDPLELEWAVAASSGKLNCNAAALEFANNREKRKLVTTGVIQSTAWRGVDRLPDRFETKNSSAPADCCSSSLADRSSRYDRYLLDAGSSQPGWKWCCIDSPSLPIPFASVDFPFQVFPHRAFSFCFSLRLRRIRAKRESERVGYQKCFENILAALRCIGNFYSPPPPPPREQRPTDMQIFR